MEEDKANQENKKHKKEKKNKKTDNKKTVFEKIFTRSQKGENQTVISSSINPNPDDSSSAEDSFQSASINFNSTTVQSEETLVNQSKSILGNIEQIVGEFFSNMGNEDKEIKPVKSAASIKAGDLTKNINDFNGTQEKYDLFVSECERAIERCYGDKAIEQYVVDNIVSRLNRVSIEFSKYMKVDTWKQVKEICDHLFKDDKPEGQIIKEIVSLEQGNKSVFNYYGEFARLIKEYADIVCEKYDADDPLLKFSMDKTNEFAVVAFEAGLNSKIREALAHKESKTMKDIYERARKHEALLKDIKKREGAGLAAEMKELIKLAKVSENRFQNPQVNRTEELVECQLCKGGHSAKQCPLNQNNVICQLCDGSGHTAADCRSAGNFKSNNGQRQGATPKYSNQGGNFNRGNFNGNNYNQGNNFNRGNNFNQGNQGNFNNQRFNGPPQYNNNQGYYQQGNGFPSNNNRGQFNNNNGQFNNNGQYNNNGRNNFGNNRR